MKLRICAVFLWVAANIAAACLVEHNGIKWASDLMEYAPVFGSATLGMLGVAWVLSALAVSVKTITKE